MIVGVCSPAGLLPLPMERSWSRIISKNPQKRRSSEKNTYTTTVMTNCSLKTRNAGCRAGAAGLWAILKSIMTGSLKLYEVFMQT